MTGGGEKKKTNQMIDSQIAQNKQFNTQMSADQMAKSNTAYDQNQSTYNDILKGYQNYANGDFNTGGSGAYVPSFTSGDYGTVRNAYMTAMGDNGGLDAGRVGKIDEALAGMGNIGKFGAADADAAARLRGGGYYEDLVKTGGYSPTDIAGIRARSTAPMSSYYSNLRDTTGRLARVSGGATPNTAAALARMSRQSGQDIGNLAANTELDIADRVRAGKLTGAQGLTSTEQAITNNMMSGLGSSAAGNQALAESIRSGQQWGTTGLEGIADKSAAANASASAAAANEERYRNSLIMAGLGGMMDLRGQNLGSESQYLNNLYGGQQILNQAGQAGVNQRIQNNPSKNPWDVVTGLAGGAAGVMTGIGAL